MRGDLLLLLVLSSLLMAVVVLRPEPAPAEPEPSTSAAPPPAVEPPAARVGVLTATRSAQVSAPVPGRLAAVHVAVGDVVRAGDLLATLQDVALTASLEEARARAAVSRARLDRSRLEHRILAQEADSLSALSAVIDRRTIEAAASQADRAAADVATAQAVLEADLAHAASLEQQHAQLSVRAPFEGVVSLLLAEVGEVVGPARPVVSLSATSRSVRAAMEPEDLDRIQQGDPVTVLLASERRCQGRILTLAPWVDPASAHVLAEISLADPSCVGSTPIGAAVAIELPGDHHAR